MTCGKPCSCPSYREHLLSVSIGAAALPSRMGSVIDTERRERAFGKDADAYRRLRRDGLQPQHVDGSHLLEATARTAAEVEGVPTTTGG